VDPEPRRNFWEKLFELADTGTTILVSSHYMDEAERCHRLAVLDRGHLVADGSPAELTGNLRGRTFTVHAQQPRRIRQKLLQMKGVVSAAQIGNNLRVLCEDKHVHVQQWQRVLEQAGLKAEIQPTEPSLEDVFVAVTNKPAKTSEEAL
jgi:ABC-2 type transport system ATP-binding protein